MATPRPMANEVNASTPLDIPTNNSPPLNLELHYKLIYQVQAALHLKW